MFCRIQRAIACLTLLATLTIDGGQPSSLPAPEAEQTLENVASTQVRLRKLHLVRPDLIPYPIAYEVCC